ncbi:MAG: ferritin-like domain-containing protein [Rhodospirillaceae bacterium]
MKTLSDGLSAVLKTGNASAKANLALQLSFSWVSTSIMPLGVFSAPKRPTRVDGPTIKLAKEMPDRGRGNSLKNRIALLHALVHIELNAIDLACDLISRFGTPALPKAFFDDWVQVAGEEATHFQLLENRLKALGSFYGALPAHNGLWEAAQKTSHDLLARLAVVPLVLEARGLDVSAKMIENFMKAGDLESAEILKRIYQDEIGHVAIGNRWFSYICCSRKLDPPKIWPDLVGRYFNGKIKPPFNHEARARAGFKHRDYQKIPSKSG